MSRAVRAPTPLARLRRLGAFGLVFLGSIAVVAAANAEEVDGIAEVLRLRPGTRVADVGAGDGEWSVGLARAVGPTGHVYATEIADEELAEIRERVAAEELANVTVLRGGQTDTGLPPGCCDALLLRMVYHHFTHPREMLRSLAEALRPEGRMAVIDIVPQRNWRHLDGVPERGGHGIPFAELVEELAAGGWRLVERHESWNGDEERFCAVFVPAPAVGPEG